MTARLAAWLVGGVVLGAATTARAQPRIDTSRCPSFTADDARRAVVAELGAVGRDREARLTELTVVVECPDAITARVRVEPAPDDEPARVLDLGDMPGELRLRVVALAAAELIDVALTRPPQLDDAPAGPPPPPEELGPRGEGGQDAQALAGGAPGGAPRRPRRVAAASPPGDAVARLDRAARGGRAAPPGDAQLHVRGGVRSFLAAPAPLTEVGAELRRGRLALDVFGATTSVDDELGSVRGVVAGAGVAWQLGCRGGAGTYLCALARGGAGLATARPTSLDDRIVSEAATAPFVELGPRLEARVAQGRWHGTLAVGLAWSAGLIVLAEDREQLHLAGAVATASLSLGWTP